MNDKATAENSVKSSNIKAFTIHNVVESIRTLIVDKTVKSE